jgi:ankyrin repeat protein
MDLVSEILAFIENCSEDELRLRLCADYANFDRDTLLIAFYYAINNRPISIVQVFLDHGLSPNETMTTHKHSALFQAVNACRVALIKHLISRGADVDAKDDQGFSVLHWATDIVCDAKVQANEENYEVIRVLLENGAIANTVDHNGTSPFLLASTVYRVPPVVDMLHEALSR